MKIDDITVHHTAPIINEFVCYSKGKKYTYKEYSKLIHRKQLIKDIVKDVMLAIILGVVMVFRAYVFFEYGI